MGRVKYVSVTQAAALARVDRRTVINWCNEKRFDCTKVGEVWVINERSLLEFLTAKFAF